MRQVALITVSMLVQMAAAILVDAETMDRLVRIVRVEALAPRELEEVPLVVAASSIIRKQCAIGNQLCAPSEEGKISVPGFS